MADVYLVSAKGVAGFTKLMVIKELRPDLAGDEEFVEMFLSEARLAARLQNPNVVQTYEIKRTDRRLFLSMEYLEGQPLHRVLVRSERRSPDVQRLYLRCICDLLSGLHYAHELKDYNGSPMNLVHRDVSPHNLFLLYSGHAKLVDFGIAKVAGDVQDTRSGFVKGKAGYMAPEQAMALSVDRRADIYSCGVLLWEALAGRRMWRGIDEVAVIAKLLEGDVPSLSAAAPSAPQELVAVCERALRPDPNRRYATAYEMRSDLLSAIKSLNFEMTDDEAGRYITELFETERSKLANVIQEHMDQLTQSDGATSLEALSDEAQLGVTHASFGSRTVARQLEPAPEPSGLTQPERTTVPTVVPASSNPSMPRWQLAAIAAVAVGGIGMLLLRDPSPPAGPDDSIAGATASSAQQLEVAKANDSTTQASCLSPNKPLVELTGDIEDNATLTCDRDYLLKFNVFVLDGVTLTIEPGTTVKGDRATQAALVVQPGGRLVAEGTPDQPIVFTSEMPPAKRRPGDWGGIVMLGHAPTNLKDERGQPSKGQVEGISSRGEYGGLSPEDSSGSLRYVRIEYPGSQLAPSNELNGLTLAGVGRGTRIEHVQVRQPLDDCFQFFGGNADAKYLICQSGGDDGFDWDYGYRGRLQFLALQSGNTGHGLEGDNDPAGSLNAPRSSPIIYNATLCGNNPQSGKARYGLLARRGTQLGLHNSAITGFHAGYDLQDLGTEVNITGSRFFGNGLNPVAFPEQPGESGPRLDDDSGWDETAEFLANQSNSIQPMPIAGCSDPNNPRFAPETGLAPDAPPAPDDGFFAPAPYVGAVKDAHDNWYRASWTRWSSR